MADIVGGISVSHAPGITGWPDHPPADQQEVVFDAFTTLRRFVAEQEPTLIVAFLDDHFDNHYRDLMPSISVGVADTHSGPEEQYYELLKIPRTYTVAGAPARGEELLEHLVREGFGAARMGPSVYGNNLAVPMELIRPEYDIPVLPVYVNVFTPPLITMGRAVELGAAVRAAAEGWDERVLFLGTGGLSHWPPVWYETTPEDDAFLARMRRYQEIGPAALEDDPGLRTDVGPYEIRMAEALGDAVVNAEWDREFLDLLVAGRLDDLARWTYEDVEKGGGHGGHEILNWMAVAGAMGSTPAHLLAYAPTPQWICGTGAVLYADAVPT